MADALHTIASLVRVDGAARMLAGPLAALPEGCSGEQARVEPAVAQAVRAAAQIVLAYPLPLGDALPGLHLIADRMIGLEDLRTGIRNGLARRDISTWGALACRSGGDLLDIPNFGRMSVEAICEAAVWRMAAIAVDSAARWPQPPGAPAAAQPGNGTSDAAPAPEWIALPLRALAAWAITEHEVTTLGGLLRLTPDLGPLPPEVAREWERARELDLRAFATRTGSAAPLPARHHGTPPPGTAS